MLAAMKRILLLALALLTVQVIAAADALRLTLPTVCYAVPGVQMNIYYDNIVLTQTPENYRFTVNCSVGKSEARRWTVTPTDKDVGTHPLSVTVADASGKVLGKRNTTLRIVPANAGASKTRFNLEVSA
jgi:hypothetical protein